MAQLHCHQQRSGSESLAETQEHNPEQAILNKGLADSVEIAESHVTEEGKVGPVLGASVDSKSSIGHSKSPSLKARKRGISEPFLDSEPTTKKCKDLVSPSKLENNLESKPAFPSPPDMPANALDKETWQGFCDIESEPACFSVILREMGVKDVTVQEVFTMDQNFIHENVPQPIYGFILLFHYRPFGKEGQEDERSNKVWFANQLPAQNSCATLAMINILMNQSTEVRIGEHLEQFKDFTKNFTPYQRGEAFASFQFIKRIHNSFAKKMDILEGDKHLSYKARRAKRLKVQSTEKTKPKKRNTKSRRSSVDSAATDDSQESIEDNAHHYIAFIPVGNEVWKLDGLDRYPTCVGSFEPDRGETWLESVSETIATLMAAGDDDYGVIALTQSPLVSLRKRTSLITNTLKCVESRLDDLSSSTSQNWRDSVSTGEQLPSPRMLGIEEQSATDSLSNALKESIDKEDTEQLLARRQQLITQANENSLHIMTEMQNEVEEDAKATQRRYDSGPVIKKWLEMLAENGFLEENLERFMPRKTKKK